LATSVVLGDLAVSVVRVRISRFASLLLAAGKRQSPIRTRQWLDINTATR
jgi:hypothetical protein